MAMSVPCRTPESTSTVRSGPTASRTAGSRSMGAMARSSWRPPWLDSWRPSTPASTARRASAAPSGPLMTSLPGHCSRSAAMSSQSMPGSKRLPVWAIVTGWRRVRLARPAAGLRSMRTQ